MRDRFGIPEITLYELESAWNYEYVPPVHDFLGSVIIRSAKLEPAQAIELVERLARDDAFWDGYHGCACGSLGIRIARGREHVDFIVDCANVFVAGRRSVGTLASDLSDFVDHLHVVALRRPKR